MKNQFIKTTFMLIAGILLSINSFSQTSAGKCWHLDYDKWVTAEYPDVHGNCGTNPILNPGANFTMEAWVRSYTFGLNMKMFGKMPATFNKGYVMGFENMHIYSQIQNPDNQELPRSGNGPIPQDSAWVHLATTYSATGDMINYLNGEEVGRTTIFPQNPVASTDDPFIIGRSPWDFSWAFNGGIDEIRIWNTQRTQQEIKDYMFKELLGSESGLLAYYNFNTPDGETFYDKTSNGNDGTMTNYDQECFSWKNSFAPVGNATMYSMHDVQSAWCGKVASQFNYSITTNGLTLLADGMNEKEFGKYLVFGHNNESGITALDAPENAPADFRRSTRTWYVNKAGWFNSQAVFNIPFAANGGDALSLGSDPTQYTLLHRSTNSGNFNPVHSANIVNGDYVVFSHVYLESGYYTIGHGSTQLAEPSAISAIKNEIQVNIYPNPAKDFITIENAKGTYLEIYNIAGQAILKKTLNEDKATISTSSLKPGVYLAKFSSKFTTTTRRVIISSSVY